LHEFSVGNQVVFVELISAHVDRCCISHYVFAVLALAVNTILFVLFLLGFEMGPLSLENLLVSIVGHDDVEIPLSSLVGYAVNQND
jgi:hypothetical protein